MPDRLLTPRLAGRPVAPDDARFLLALFGEAGTARVAAAAGRPWDAARAEAGAARFVAHWAAHGFGLRVWEEAGRPALLAGLQFCVIDGRAEIEASFATLPARRGRGLAGEAMAATMAEAPEIARDLAAVVRAGNAPALALLARLGFRETGRDAERRLLRRAAPPLEARA